MLVGLFAFALLVAACPTRAFVQLLGDNNKFYCDAEGSYCLSDASCCAGLQCVVQFNGLMRGMGGICQRRRNAGPPAASPQQVRPAPETEEEEEEEGGLAFAPAPPLSCSVDSDCPNGQCCLHSGVGFRGGQVATCEPDCGGGGGVSPVAGNGGGGGVGGVAVGGRGREAGDILGDFYSRYYRSGEKAMPWLHKAHKEHHKEMKENKEKEKKEGKKNKAEN